MPDIGSAKRRRAFAIVFAVAALLALPIIAQAAHWPNFGGDAGRSGNQPVLAAKLPTAFDWTANDPGTIRNSPIMTGGPDPGNQFSAYGKTVVVNNTNNDRAEVNIRKLDDGAQKITDQSERDVDDGTDDTDAFGGISGAGVSFVDSSTDEGPGQLYVVHNDTDSPARTGDDCAPERTRTSSLNDISIAQFDVASGTKKADFSVGRALGINEPGQCSTKTQVSDGYTIESSPVITPAVGSTGLRWIFFIARKDTAGPARLFGVSIDNAGSATAVINSDSPQVRDIEGANTLASPSLVYLNSPGQLQSGTALYVAVPINGSPGASDIRTFQVGDISDPTEDGPAGGDAAGIPRTISVPVTQSGRMPGQPDSGTSKAPSLYVAYDNGDDTTTVRKFVQQGASAKLTLDAATTPTPVAGTPSPALALSVLAAQGGGEVEGRVAVATDKNLFLLDSETTTPVEQLADPGETLGAGNAFARNSPLISGELIFIANDDGLQAVLNLSDVEPVGSGFAQHDANQGADFAIGQPSYSRGHLQFLTDRGVFVYNTDVVVPPNDAPIARFTASPNPANVGQQITFDASASSDPEVAGIAKYEWDFDGNGTYEVDRGSDPKTTVAFPAAGTFTVGLRVTDVAPSEGAPAETATTTGQIVINPPPNKAPEATFTITPNPARVDQRVTFDASASRDADGAIARYEWDLDGNGTYETNSGESPRVQRSYSRRGNYGVKLRATDTAGAATEVLRQLTVTGTTARKTPRRLTAKVSPRRDAARPYRFRTTGRLTRPSGVSRASGCNGRVTVVVKVGKKTISRRTTALRRNCTYRTRVSFRDRKRLGRASRLRFTARFQGNKALRAKSARTVRVRIG